MYFVLLPLIVVFDQLTKLLVSQQFAVHESRPLIKGIFHLSLVHNSGAAFGIFKGMGYVIVAVSLAAIVYIAYTLRKHHANAKAQRLYLVALSLIMAGTVGNLIDRIRLGYVIDFLDFRVWPVFNVADSAITVGAILLGWKILRGGKGDKR
jgi:signal peptidase II